MIERRSQQPGRVSLNADDYDALFVFQVHQLIKLGYVQSDDEQTWAAKLEELMTAEAADYRVVPGSGWRHEPILADLPYTYRSNHRRGRGKRPIEVRHTLLRFC